MTISLKEDLGRRHDNYCREKSALIEKLGKSKKLGLHKKKIRCMRSRLNNLNTNLIPKLIRQMEREKDFT